MAWMACSRTKSCLCQILAAVALIASAPKVRKRGGGSRKRRQEDGVSLTRIHQAPWTPLGHHIVTMGIINNWAGIWLWKIMAAHLLKMITAMCAKPPVAYLITITRRKSARVSPLEVAHPKECLQSRRERRVKIQKLVKIKSKILESTVAHLEAGAILAKLKRRDQSMPRGTLLTPWAQLVRWAAITRTKAGRTCTPRTTTATSTANTPWTTSPYAIDAKKVGCTRCQVVRSWRGMDRRRSTRDSWGVISASCMQPPMPTQLWHRTKYHTIQPKMQLRALWSACLSPTSTPGKTALKAMTTAKNLIVIYQIINREIMATKTQIFKTHPTNHQPIPLPARPIIGVSFKVISPAQLLHLYPPTTNCSHRPKHHTTSQ